MMRSLFNKGSLAADKAAALRAVGVEFDGKVARAIREQHEGMASGKGKAAEAGNCTKAEARFDWQLEKLKEYKRRHGACLRVLSAMVRWLGRAMRLQVSEALRAVLAAACPALAGHAAAPPLIASCLRCCCQATRALHDMMRRGWDSGCTRCGLHTGRARWPKARRQLSGRRRGV